MHPYETYLGVDGQLHSINTLAELLHDEKTGLPYAWKIHPLPDVKLIARVPDANPMKIEDHPLRKAMFKYLAAKEHKIYEKQRPQDVTIFEAKTMVENALLEAGVHKDDLPNIMAKFYP